MDKVYIFKNVKNIFHTTILLVILLFVINIKNGLCIAFRLYINNKLRTLLSLVFQRRVTLRWVQL